MVNTRAGLVIVAVLVGAGMAQAQPAGGRVRGISGALAGERPGDPTAERRPSPTTPGAPTTPTAPTTPATPATPAAPLAANEERFSASITIKGSPEFRAKIKAELERLRGTRTGGALLAALDQAGKPVTVAFGPNHCVALAAEAYALGVTKAGRRVTVDRANTGSGSKVMVRGSDDPCFPNITTLAHELIHALHNAQGRNVRNEDYTQIEPGTANHEEARTIGLGAYAQEQLTDNAIRRELRVPARSSHAGSCGPGH